MIHIGYPSMLYHTAFGVRQLPSQYRALTSRCCDHITIIIILNPSSSCIPKRIVHVQMESIQVLGFYFLGLLACALVKKVISKLLFAHKLRRIGCHVPNRYPQRVPYIGSDLSNILDKSRQEGTLFTKLQQIFQTYGKTFQATLWGQTLLYTIDPANIKAIHTVEFNSFGVESIRKPVNHGWIGDGIFMSDGSVWKLSRTLLKPVFSKGQYANLPGLEVHVQRLLALVPRDGTTIDLQPLFSRFVSLIPVLSFLEISCGALHPYIDGLIRYLVSRCIYRVSVRRICSISASGLFPPRCRSIQHVVQPSTTRNDTTASSRKGFSSVQAKYRMAGGVQQRPCGC